jgi:hypothetical protein
MYTNTLLMSRSTPSISLWKLAGHPSNPMGDVIQWNCPLPGSVKAIKFCESSWSYNCQKPEVRSSILKMVKFALQMSLIHSVISFMECLSMCEFWYSLWKILNDPESMALFLGTQKMGELYSKLDLLTTPYFNHLSNVCWVNWW